MRISLEQKECFCNLTTFYENVAKKDGCYRNW